MKQNLKELVAEAKTMAEEATNRKISANQELYAFAEKFAGLIIRECEELCQFCVCPDEFLDHFGLGATDQIPDPHPIPDYADVMTAEEFAEAVDDGMFTPDDGSGYWATNDKQSHLSVWSIGRPDWATHVAWYNR